eukprot:GILI01040554.1.p1 GENE.GILI01040554.1~~GILI01040554.1.p1  ORF type:complete len:240 (+),score=57.98 GILI01040554.1:35-721(+)
MALSIREEALKAVEKWVETLEFRELAVQKREYQVEVEKKEYIAMKEKEYEQKRLDLEADYQRLREELAQKKREFEEEKRAMATYLTQFTEIVEINCGGTILQTNRATLLQFEPTRLDAIFSGRWDVPLDKDGRVFLDRDPEDFSLILLWLRNPEEPVPLSDHNKEKMFQKEVAWWGLTRFVYPFAAPPVIGALYDRSEMGEDATVDKSEFVDPYSFQLVTDDSGNSVA